MIFEDRISENITILFGSLSLKSFSGKKWTPCMFSFVVTCVFSLNNSADHHHTEMAKAINKGPTLVLILN